jgi:hypothetical protein
MNFRLNLSFETTVKVTGGWDETVRSRGDCSIYVHPSNRHPRLRGDPDFQQPQLREVWIPASAGMTWWELWGKSE